MWIPGPNQRVLVVVAHPDDETLGCGGTIARLTAEGVPVKVWIAADGVGSREVPPQSAHERRCAARRALAVLGVEHVTFENFPDNRMDTVSRLDIAKSIERAIDEWKADTLLTHSQGDLNFDHRIVGECAAIASRPSPGSPVNQRYCFEVPSSTGWFPESQAAFAPNLYVDISAALKTKIRALSEYESEMRPKPHARSVESLVQLAGFRGANVGFVAAEAFEIAFVRL